MFFLFEFPFSNDIRIKPNMKNTLLKLIEKDTLVNLAEYIRKNERDKNIMKCATINRKCAVINVILCNNKIPS